MHGTMMNVPLTVDLLLRRARDVYPHVEVVSRRADRSVHRRTLGEVAARATSLARALVHAGVKKGDRVATLMWNHAEHLEAYLGVPLAGAILHTLNLRLHPDDIAYIATDADDSVLLVDEILFPLYQQLADRLPRQASRRGGPRLRRVPAKCTRFYRAPQARRRRSSGPLLHQRHHRPAERRSLHPSLHAAALPGERPARFARPCPARPLDARGADVPRERVGPALHGHDGGCEAGLPWSAPRRREPPRPHGVGTRHHRRWRAHLVDRHPGSAVRRADPLEAAARRHHDRGRLGGTRGAHSRLRLRSACASCTRGA